MIKHKIWAEIDTSALEHNYNTVKQHVQSQNPDCTLMCIVKADCYGHGTELCVPALYGMGVRDFGVSCIEEALDVRGYAPDARILILGYTPPENVPLLIDNGITQSVYSYEYAQALSASARSAEGTLSCHIKIDTGMNRIGYSVKDPDSARLIYESSKLPSLRLDGAFTHFACADETEGEHSEMSRDQYEGFVSLLSTLGEMGVSFDTVHCCNSAAAIRYPEYNMDMIRLGIMLYGHSPFEIDMGIELRPVMRFVTTVTHVHTLRAGDSVSYGAAFTADRDMRLATVAAGYADGFLRILGRGGMYIRGKYAPVVGRVCMDQCMLDITDIDGVCVGDEAEIFDSEGENIKTLSAAANTISYELLCSVSKRVNRIKK